MSEPIYRPFGWCSPNDYHRIDLLEGNVDVTLRSRPECVAHNRCRKTYVTAAGVTVVCSCPNHQEEQ